MNTVRKLRALGLSALALLAIGGVSASAAQAGEFETAIAPATVTGLNVGGPHEITTNLGVMNCPVTYEGELAEASEELTLTPVFGPCGLAGKEVDVETNGCDIRFNAGATLFLGFVEGSMDVICPEGNMIDFGITNSGGCHIGIPEQLGLGEVTYRSTTMPSDVDVEFNIQGLAYELNANCPVMGGFANGEYAGDSTLSAHSGGMATALAVK
jgi:hypothetical protein